MTDELPSLGPAGLSAWFAARFRGLADDVDLLRHFPATQRFHDDPRFDLVESFGLRLWDVLSDGHRVTTSDGRAVDLGTSRFAGEIIAIWLNHAVDAWRFGYASFHLGSEAWVDDDKRVDDAVAIAGYREIFRRLHAHGDRWWWTIDAGGRRRAARRSEVPAHVRAYREVAGDWPAGWRAD